MTITEQMLHASPADLGSVDQNALARCIDACAAYVQTSTACADLLTGLA